MDADTKPQRPNKPWRLGNNLIFIQAGKDDRRETFIMHADAVRQAFPDLLDKIALYHAQVLRNTVTEKHEADMSRPVENRDSDSNTPGNPTPTPSQCLSETNQHGDVSPRQLEVLGTKDHAFVLPDEDPDSIALLVHYVYRGSFPKILRREKPPAVLSQPFANMAAPAPLTLADLCPGGHWTPAQGIPGITVHPERPLGSALSTGAAGTTEWYAHICLRPEYNGLSPEELRLRDYLALRLDTKTVDASHSTTLTPSPSTFATTGTTSHKPLAQPTATSIWSGQSTTRVGKTTPTPSGSTPIRASFANAATILPLLPRNASVTTSTIPTATSTTDSVVPKRSQSKTATSQNTTPQAMNPHPTKPQATQSQATEAQTTGSQATKSQTTKSEPATSQVQLLSLALAAERFGCEELFNVVTDAYMLGEIEEQVWEEDIEMVWKPSGPSHKSSPVLQGMFVSRILLGASMGQSEIDYEWMRQFKDLERAVMGAVWKQVTTGGGFMVKKNGGNGSWRLAGGFTKGVRKHHIHGGIYYQGCTKCG